MCANMLEKTKRESKALNMINMSSAQNPNQKLKTI